MNPQALSAAELRELAAFRADRGAVVTLVLGGQAAHPAVPAALESRLDSLVARGRREARPLAGELTRAARLAVDRDLGRAADGVRETHAHAGVACFADTPDGLWRCVAAPGASTDAVRVARAPYLVPLVDGRPGRVLVALVGRERGAIYELEGAALVEIRDLFERQPRRHRAAEAWQQVRLERRTDRLAHDHLRRAAAELDRLVEEAGGTVVVLAGEREHTSALCDLLAPRPRAAVAGTVPAETHAGAVELLPLVLPLVEARRLDEENAAVARWRSGLGRGLAVEGRADTLAAAAAGRVQLLLFSALEVEPDAADLAVHLALLHGGDVRRVDDPARLGARDGFGALLRFS